MSQFIRRNGPFLPVPEEKLAFGFYSLVRVISSIDNTMLETLLHRISCLDTHHRLIIALLVASLVLLLVWPTVSGPALIIIVWVAFAFTVLVMVWISIFRIHPRDLHKLSRIQDSSRVLILTLVVGAALASLFAVIALLDAVTDSNRALYITLATLAVANSWALVHTVFINRYAHQFYGNTPSRKKRPGGLDFPQDDEPDYLDFAYFSFIIGMTSQVSDVAITSKEIRRTALAHGVLSFLFNTIIIALTVGGLAGKL